MSDQHIGSFRGVLIATSGHGTLIGGCRRLESARFSTREDAQRWLDVVMDVNAEAKREHDGGTIELSSLAPEIGNHGAGALNQITSAEVVALDVQFQARKVNRRKSR